MELRSPPRAQGPRGTSPGMRILVGLQVLTLAAIGAVVLTQARDHGKTAGDSEHLRRVASQLKAGGALDEAAALYERYVEDDQHDAASRANVAYSVGTIYLQQGRYERALRWFYEAEALGAGELQGDVAEKIVHSLERLGRVHAARSALASRTQLETDDVTRPADDPVVARIGSTKLHATDIQRALDDLPPELAHQFSTPAQREAFLRKYVADELIWRKAQKLEYDEDPDVRRRLDFMFKQLVVDAFVKEEILGKIDIHDADLATYHAANRDRYDQKQAARLRVIRLASLEKAKTVRAALQGSSFAALAKQHSLDAATRDNGGLISRWVERGEDFLPGGDAAAIGEAVFALGKGGTSEPIAAGKHAYLVQVVDLRPAKERPFAKVRQLVERDYRLMKMQAAYQELIASELSAEDVELMPENLAKAP